MIMVECEAYGNLNVFWSSVSMLALRFCQTMMCKNLVLGFTDLSIYLHTD